MLADCVAACGQVAIATNMQLWAKLDKAEPQLKVTTVLFATQSAGSLSLAVSLPSSLAAVCRCIHNTLTALVVLARARLPPPSFSLVSDCVD